MAAHIKKITLFRQQCLPLFQHGLALVLTWHNAATIMQV